MDLDETIQLVEKTLSIQGGKLDALTAAVAGMLQAAKGNPGIAKFVASELEKHHADHVAKAVNAQYLQSFELTRIYLLSMIQ